MKWLVVLSLFSAVNSYAEVDLKKLASCEGKFESSTIVMQFEFIDLGEIPVEPGYLMYGMKSTMSITVGDEVISIDNPELPYVATMKRNKLKIWNDAIEESYVIDMRREGTATSDGMVAFPGVASGQGPSYDLICKFRN